MELILYGLRPTNCLEICGTSNPTKAITPAIAVDTAAKSTAIAEIIRRTLVTCKPKFFAVLSCSDNKLHQAPTNSARIRPIVPYVTIISTSPHVFIVILEVVVCLILLMKYPQIVMNDSFNPVNIALIAIPTKIIRSGLNPDFHENA